VPSSRPSSAGHGRPLVDEHPDVALGRGQGERVGQRGHAAELVPDGGPRERLQTPDLDHASGPSLHDRERVQVLQQAERTIGRAAGEQQPGEAQVGALARIVGAVVGAQPVLPDPDIDRVDLALDEQQPEPQGGDGVEQVGDVGAGRRPLGLADRPPGTVRVARGLSKPGDRGQSVGQRLGVAVPAALRNAVRGVREGRVDLVALVGDLGHADVSDSGGWQDRGRPGGGLDRLPVGVKRRGEAVCARCSWPRW
jgi:hypothetical protein